ncbi:MAG: hypothetical protein ACYDGY_01425 [Acidimicrobiales bacterium]
MNNNFMLARIQVVKRALVGWLGGLAAAVGAMLVLAASGSAAYAAGTTTGTANFTGTASANGLLFFLGGTSLTLGTASARGSSVMSGGAVDQAAAQSSGDGELLPVLSANTAASSSQKGTGDNQPQRCATPPVPSLGPLGHLLTLGLACGSADTAINAAGYLNASSTGSVASVGLDLAGLLNTVVGPSSPLASGLQTILGQLPKLPAAGAPLSTVLGEVLHLATTSQILGIMLGPAGSDARIEQNSSTGVVSSTTQSAGTQIQVFPGAGGTGVPLIGISAGTSGATAEFNPATHTLSSSDSPGVVSVSVFTPVGGQKSFSLAPGQSQTILSGTPLQSTIALGAGSHSVSGNTATASATGLTVDLLEGIGASSSDPYGGGIRLILTNASVNLARNVTSTPVTTTTTQPPNIPGPTSVHTGEPWAGWAAPLVALPVVLGLLLLAWPYLYGRIQPGADIRRRAYRRSRGAGS